MINKFVLAGETLVIDAARPPAEAAEEDLLAITLICDGGE
jgi:hypothetical protein